MIEVYGDMWQMSHSYDAVCVTVNWETNNQGHAIMGAGCAKEAQTFYPNAALRFGEIISQNTRPGCCVIPVRPAADVSVLAPPLLIAFPTKYSWRNPADIDLIIQSAEQLNTMIANMPTGFTCLLPRPGTGRGGLDWFTTVKPAIQDMLSDRIHIVSFALHKAA